MLRTRVLLSVLLHSRSSRSSRIAILYHYSLPRPGWWTSFSLAYGEGGQTSVDRVSKNTKQRNWRFGANFSMPLGKRHGLSLRINTGINDGAGGDFDSVSIVYTFQSADRTAKKQAANTGLAVRDPAYGPTDIGGAFSNTTP